MEIDSPITDPITKMGVAHAFGPGFWKTDPILEEMDQILKE